MAYIQLLLIFFSLLSLTLVFFYSSPYFPSLKSAQFVRPSLFQLVLSFFLYFGVQLFFPQALASVIGHIFQGNFEGPTLVSEDLYLFLGLFSLQIASFALSLHAYALKNDEGTNIFGSFSLRYLSSALIAYLLILAPFLLLSYTMRSLLHYFEFSSEKQVALVLLEALFSKPYLLSMALLNVIFVAPLSEELLFRGFLQGFFKRFVSSKTALILASLIFSFLHFSPSQKMSNFEILPPLFFLSLALGQLYNATASIWPSFFMHAIFNTVSTFVFLSFYHA